MLFEDLRSMKNQSICFLIINKINLLPSIAIESCLSKTEANIYIGYVSESNIQEIPYDPRISYIDLTEEAEEAGIRLGEYKDFSEEDFFRLVVLKWALIRKSMEISQSKFVVYSDIDVLWINDPVSAISDSFDEEPESQIFVQDFTANPASPNLCMGFAAFRNGERSYSLISELSDLHKVMLIENSRFGDDDVITRYFRRSNRREIKLLPQPTFPVGNLGKLFSPVSLYPGINSPTPYIFHANFVVGNSNKISYLVLISKFLGTQIPTLPVRIKFMHLMRLALKRIKYRLKI